MTTTVATAVAVDVGDISFPLVTFAALLMAALCLCFVSTVNPDPEEKLLLSLFCPPWMYSFFAPRLLPGKRPLVPIVIDVKDNQARPEDLHLVLVVRTLPR